MKNSIFYLVLICVTLSTNEVLGSAESCLDGNLTEYSIMRKEVYAYSILINELCFSRRIGVGSVVLNVPIAALFRGEEMQQHIFGSGLNARGLTLYSLESNSFRSVTEPLLMERSTENISEVTVNGYKYKVAEYENGRTRLLPANNASFYVDCALQRGVTIYCTFSVFVSDSNIQYGYLVSEVEDPKSFDWMLLYSKVERFVENILIE
ncbi:hypothetical protein [Saccharospirillum alexandrii]|uniref:hypothetical protein n=1 Tax=Saccharospirillum alexandrii TaxID=2448477 RepID=UPI000FD761B4|nr:hypothetical protein [Saccharospirillum alexandrii]